MTTAKKTIVRVPDKFRDPFLFEGLLPTGKDYGEGGVSLDMSGVGFIEPYSMVAFLLLGRNYLRDTGRRMELLNIPVQIHQYMDRMNFFEHEIFEVPTSLDEKFFLRRSKESKKLIELTEIPNKEKRSLEVIASVIALFRKRASSILKYWMSEEVVGYFITVISELCQNIFEHSLDSGFLAMQTYDMGRENVVRLVIGDSGIGIRKSFEDVKNIKFGTTADLLEKVMTMPISSKRPHGYGLCQVSDIVERLNGEIYLRSCDASLTMLFKRKGSGGRYVFHKNGLEHFRGTQISITLSRAKK